MGAMLARLAPVGCFGDTDRMIGHLGVNVADLATSKAYYDQLMPLLAFESFIVHDDQFAYRPSGSKPGTFIFFYPAGPGSTEHSREATGLQHLAFIVPTRTVVHDVAAKVVELGSTIVHEPQVFPQYPQPYFACFWTDPSGIMIEAVCHHDRD